MEYERICFWCEKVIDSEYYFEEFGVVICYRCYELLFYND